MYLYSTRLVVNNNVPSFECKSYCIKKYSAKKKRYYLQYEKSYISDWRVGSKTGGEWIFATKEERDNAIKEQLDNYISQSENYIKESIKFSKKRLKELEQTKQYYKIMFPNE